MRLLKSQNSAITITIKVLYGFIWGDSNNAVKKQLNVDKWGWCNNQWESEI